MNVCIWMNEWMTEKNTWKYFSIRIYSAISKKYLLTTNFISNSQLFFHVMQGFIAWKIFLSYSWYKNINFEANLMRFHELFSGGRICWRYMRLLKYLHELFIRFMDLWMNSWEIGKGIWMMFDENFYMNQVHSLR